MDNGEASPIIAAGETIRGELHELLGTNAEEIGRRLTELLAAAAEPQARPVIEDRIVRLLAEQPRTRERLTELLDEAEAERAMLGEGSSYQPVPGGVIVGAIGFACPRVACPYVWPWVDVNETPPKQCPRDGSPLTPIMLD